MFREFYLDIFKEDIIGIVIGVLIWLATLLVIILLGYGLFHLIDSTYLPIHTDIGEIMGKNFKPGHYQTTYVKVGNVLSPITTYISDKYSLVIEIDGYTNSIGVNEYKYNNVNIGDQIKCDYVTGRICGGIYIKGIYN